MAQVRSDDRYVLVDSNPHTAIPDWLALRDDISYEARNFLHRLMIWRVGLLLPTCAELARRRGVDQRTIQRWLAELRSAGAIEIGKMGRRRCIKIAGASAGTGHDNTRHMGSVIHGIGDPMDRRSMVSGIETQAPSEIRQQKGTKGQSTTPWIADQPHGGGGGTVSIESEDQPPTTNATVKKFTPADIKTETGRWMVGKRFSIKKSAELQHLDLEACKADFDRRWSEGQRQGAIAMAWEVEPPSRAGQLAPASSGPFTFSDEEKARYRALGIAYGSDSDEDN